MLKKKVKELNSEVKDWESKYQDLKMLLSKVQAQNTDLQKEVWELKAKLNLKT